MYLTFYFRQTQLKKVLITLTQMYRQARTSPLGYLIFSFYIEFQLVGFLNTKKSYQQFL